MNKIFKNILLAAALTLSLGACQDDILSQSSPSTFEAEKVFSNYVLAQSAYDGIWDSILNGQCYNLRYQCYYGANTDIEINLNYDKTNQDLQRYNATPTHNRLNATDESFSLFYQAIERANLALDGLKKYADMENDERMRILYAQVLTLRAHVYCDLTRAYGDIPARFVPVSQDELYKPKVSRDVIFKQVLADLDEAIPVLPYPGEHEMTSDAYHINKIYAAGLFSRIALMASGYAQRPDDDKIGTGTMGEVRLSNDPEMSKDKLYPRAIAHLSEVIEANKMTLAQDYKEYWRKFNNGELAANPKEESVFVIPYKTNGRWNYTYAVRLDNAKVNGYTVSHSPYTGPAPSFYFDFDKNDKRRKVTCFNCIGAGETVKIATIAQWFYGKFRMDQMTNTPWTGTNTDSAKPVAMRYSDVLLMAAEIENELGHLDAAKGYYRPVRARAFDEAQADAFLATLTDKETFFKAIVDERAFEFCGEHIRKADLIRWGILKEKIDETKQKLYDLRERKGQYDYLRNNKDIWYKPNPEDRWEMLIYGYDEGETSDPGEGWTKRNNHFESYDDKDLTNTAMLSKTKIESIYINDPDTRQFWPIPATAITNSQGTLVNDYEY